MARVISNYHSLADVQRIAEANNMTYAEFQVLETCGKVTIVGNKLRWFDRRAKDYYERKNL